MHVWTIQFPPMKVFILDSSESENGLYFIVSALCQFPISTVKIFLKNCHEYGRTEEMLSTFRYSVFGTGSFHKVQLEALGVSLKYLGCINVINFENGN